MDKIIVICNQKREMKKAVTAVNLRIGLVREGKRVLLVDESFTASLEGVFKLRQSKQG